MAVRSLEILAAGRRQVGLELRWNIISASFSPGTGDFFGREYEYFVVQSAVKSIMITIFILPGLLMERQRGEKPCDLRQNFFRLVRLFNLNRW